MLLRRFSQEDWHSFRRFWVNPFRTAVPFRGQTTQTISDSSPKRDCGPNRVKESRHPEDILAEMYYLYRGRRLVPLKFTKTTTISMQLLSTRTPRKWRDIDNTTHQQAALQGLPWDRYSRSIFHPYYIAQQVTPSHLFHVVQVTGFRTSLRTFLLQNKRLRVHTYNIAKNTHLPGSPG